MMEVVTFAFIAVELGGLGKSWVSEESGRS